MTERFPPLFRLIPVLALFAAGLLGNPARAEDDYAQVQRLFKQGQTAQALQQAHAYITKHPGDPQMRFIEAGELQSAGLTDKAEVILTQLTRDYPELAEPWNNLAVLYAGRGQIDAARTALETALRIDPRYATALENLGDIDIRLALRRYEQARQADAGAAARLSAKIDATRRAVTGGASPAPAPATSSLQSAASSPQPAASESKAAPSAPASAAASPEPAASVPVSAASAPEATASEPADAAPRPAAGDMPMLPATAPPPQLAASQPDAAAPETASPEPAGAAPSPEPAASEAPASQP